MTISIEPARPGDLPAILELLEQSGLPCEGLADHLPTALVARAGATIVGSAALELYGESALLRSVAVAPQLRGRGLGHQLSRSALDLARRHGVAQVYLLTETASGFFPRLGFRPIARAEVDPSLQRSAEFTGACPASAQAMVKAISSFR